MEMSNTDSSLVAAALTELVGTAHLEGAAVIDLFGDSAGPASVHEAGTGCDSVLPAAAKLMIANYSSCHGMGPGRRPILVCPVTLVGGRRGGLVLWRSPRATAWDARDHLLAATVAGLVRVILDHAQRETGIDPATGLLDLMQFLDEVNRHIARLVASLDTGTMLLVSLDGLDRFRAAHGRAATNALLAQAATLLRAMLRPSDRIGRVSHDTIAAWMDGADHMTAAERAEAIVQRRLSVPGTEDDSFAPRQTFSIGIANRQTGTDDDDAELLLDRATGAMDAVRQTGGNGWRVALSKAGSPSKPG